MLTQVGFQVGDVVEVLLTTISENDEPNAAPMGVWVQKGTSLVIRPYEETQTAHNIEKNGHAVMNLSQDPRLFLNLAFKKELPQTEPVVFEPAKTVKAPRIKDVSGYVEVLVQPKAKMRTAAQFKEYACQVRFVELTTNYAPTYSRARNAAIECIIHATKIRTLYRTDPTTTKRLVHQIDELQTFVERIAPQSPSADVIQQVEQLLSKWIK